MFATIRKHQKWLWLIVIVGVIVPFVIYLDPSYGFRQGGGKGRSRRANNFGTINGRALTEQELSDAYRDARLRFFMVSRRWPGRDAMTRQMFSAERQVQERLVLQERLRELGFLVGDEAAADWLSELFRDPQTGVVSMDQYRRFVKEVLPEGGMNESDLDRLARREAAIQQLLTLAGMSGDLVSAREVEGLYRLENEQIEAEVAMFSASNFLAGVTVTPEAIREFYTNNLGDYRRPERIQVNYVSFPTTNWLAEADAVMAQRTNLDQQLEAVYRQRGTNTFLGEDGKPMPEAAAKQSLRQQFRNEMAVVIARKQAMAFAEALYGVIEQQPGQTNSLERVAAERGLKALVSVPFTRMEGPPGIGASEAFRQAAFALTLEHPMALEPVVAPESVYVLTLRQRFPSEAPPLDDVRARVTADFRQRQALEAARAAGRSFLAVLTNGLAQGKAFGAICAEAKVQPVKLPVFSMGSRSLPGWETRIDFNLLKEVAGTLAAGKTSDFEQTQDGGVVVHLLSRQAPQESVVKAELASFRERLREERDRLAVGEWFRKESELTTVTGLPKLE